MKLFISLLLGTCTSLTLFCGVTLHAKDLAVKESLRGDGEWGWRPAQGEKVNITPPPFVWQEQDNANRYELEYSASQNFTSGVKHISDLQFNVYCPSETMSTGTWYWRVRFADTQGQLSLWSSTRKFHINKSASHNPMPSRMELMNRIPKEHPRIFIRPEDVPAIKSLTSGRLAKQNDNLIKACEKLLATPPDCSEPEKYPDNIKRPSKEWMKIWWGNRLKVIKTLDGAATLGFGYQITGDKRYGELARKILLQCLQWDPNGSTNLRYNDEAAMPYLSRISRTYSYINNLLTDSDREQCRETIRLRGNDAYRALYPNHFYHPYNSHKNRLWHFLGEAGLVFYGEIPEAEDWLHAALNVYFCVYPVWGDDDGGWHEGMWYWRQYMDRFFWWADIMKSAFGIEIKDKPFFSKTGYYAMYISPPGTLDGGFGDLAQLCRNQHARTMKYLAGVTDNPHYRWYANQLGPIKKNISYDSAYIEMARALYQANSITPTPPTDLPSSRCMWGNGLVAMNSNLLNGKNNIQIMFKSSPNGTQSHGYDANNSLLLNVYGERLLIRSGRRDMFGSNFHKNWMWETKSENNITVNGVGQKKHSRDAKGKITAFFTDKRFDYACGEANGSYNGELAKFQRQILFCKPSAILIIDTLEAKKDSTFNIHWHSLDPMQVNSQHDILLSRGDSVCHMNMLYPKNMNLSISDKFDPNVSTVKIPAQHHLRADTPSQQKKSVFITLLRPLRKSEKQGKPAAFSHNDGKFTLNIELPEGNLKINGELHGEMLNARLSSKNGEQLFKKADPQS